MPEQLAGPILSPTRSRRRLTKRVAHVFGVRPVGTASAFFGIGGWHRDEMAMEMATEGHRVATVMPDIPAVLLTATIWTYWIGVGIMIGHVRRKTHQLGGLVPEQPVEKLMWVIWTPLVIAWIVLPYLAVTRTQPALAVPVAAWVQPAYAALRWLAACSAIACLILTVRCWQRMGRNWRMDVSTERRTELVTDGLYAWVRHPIYALSMLLMICTAIIVATPAMVLVALMHIALMNLKARNEERFLRQSLGELYEAYCGRTGRFFPRRVPSGR